MFPKEIESMVLNYTYSSEHAERMKDVLHYIKHRCDDEDFPMWKIYYDYGYSDRNMTDWDNMRRVLTKEEKILRHIKRRKTVARKRRDHEEMILENRNLN